MKKTTLLFFSLGFILMMSMTSVTAQVEVGELFSCLSPDPIIDGNFSTTASEWIKGKPITVTLFEIKDQTDKIDIEIMSVQGNDLIIYFGITLPNTVLEFDILYLVFRDVEGNPICLPPHNINGTYGKDHDVMAMYMHNNHSSDMFTNDALQHKYTADTDVGGVDNGIGKCHANGTHVIVEMKKQFSTGDTIGHDFNLVVNGSIQMFIWFFDGDLAKNYCMIREADNDYDYLTLHIQCTKATPISFGVIITGIFVTATSAVIIRKRRK